MARVLVISDQSEALASLRTALDGAGHDVEVAAGGPELIERIREEPGGFDLVMVDGGVSGTAAVEVMASIHLADPLLPLLVTVDPGDRAVLEGATAAGGWGFILRPVDTTAVLDIADAALRRREVLLNAVRRHEFRADLESIGTPLSRAIDAKDEWTRRHCERTAVIAEQVARRLGLDDDLLLTCRMAATLHDIGKIGVSTAVLTKPGRLTPEEWEEVYRHPHLGASILPDDSIWDAIRAAVRHHHERHDGQGYPARLAGEAIPPAARLIAVADAFDVMLHGRVYRTPMPLEAARAEIARGMGSQFDPVSGEALLDLVGGDWPAAGSDAS